MTDVGTSALLPSGSPGALGAPGTPSADPSPLAPALPSWQDAASSRLVEVKRDPAWANAFLNGGAAERNLMRTLHAMASSDASETELAALAQSIGLERRPSLAVAEKARVAAEATAPAAYRPQYGRYGQEVSAEQLALVDKELTTWAADMKFSPVIGKAITQRIVDQGTQLRAKSPEALTAWLAVQDAALLRMAAGDQAAVDRWKDGATKFLAGKGSKWTPANSPTMRDAWFIRTVAVLGAQ